MRTAIVIVERDVDTWRRADDGVGLRSSGETFGVAHVYRKRAGRWDLGRCGAGRTGGTRSVHRVPAARHQLRVYLVDGRELRVHQRDR